MEKWDGIFGEFQFKANKQKKKKKLEFDIEANNIYSLASCCC